MSEAARVAARVSIRAADRGDARAIAEVNVAAGRAGWSAFLPPERLSGFDPPVARYEQMLADAAARVWVATWEAGAIAGFVSARAHEDGSAEVGALYVHPSRSGAGVGRALLARALEALRADGCREAALWTEERNERPRRIYEQLGWEPDGATRVRDLLGCRIREVRYRIALAPGERVRSSAAR